MYEAGIEEYYLNVAFESAFVGYDVLEWRGMEGRYGLDKVDASGDITSMSVTFYVKDMVFYYSVVGGVITRVLM